MCFGFLGIQFAFALQNANVSRIFSDVGCKRRRYPDSLDRGAADGPARATDHRLPLRSHLDAARPAQALLRHRRRARHDLLLIADAARPVLWIAAALLWMLDASINVSMEPFRAFVGDQLAPAQRPPGYAMQSFFIGLGAVVASALPWIMAQFGFSNSGASAEGG